jgi:predicted  nucleic acid-binding Zn-ribbon protein
MTELTELEAELIEARARASAITSAMAAASAMDRVEAMDMALTNAMAEVERIKVKIKDLKEQDNG